MSPEMNRRTFVKGSVLGTAGGAMGFSDSYEAACMETSQPTPPAEHTAAPKGKMPQGKIAGMPVSRMMLGGNLLTHYTHSRDLKYVYNLTAQYNTDAKILETLALAEDYGIDTLSIHVVPRALKTMQAHRKRGGKMKWIICPTAPVTRDMKAYSKQVQELIDMGTDSIYLWGVRGDRLTGRNVDLMGKAVQIAKDHGVPSGVGAHDLNAVKACEKAKIPTDFYIKTLHHHNYRTGPRPDELKGPYSEYPGYWCKDPKETVEFMKSVEKPWIAYKVMAAGAIPPKSAFQWAFSAGADHLLVGMFDFEIAEDAAIAIKAFAASAKRPRPWRS